MSDFYAGLGLLLNALFILAAVYVYGSLARQISLREVEVPDPTRRRFGRPEVIIAVLLTTFFVASVYAAGKSDRLPDPAGSAIFSIALILGLVGFLRLRGFDLSETAGLSRLGFGRSLGTGAILLLAAYPLVGLADFLTRRFLDETVSRQDIVQLFSNSENMQERAIIIIIAVAIAPIAEEFIFRYFLHGTIKRFAGRWAGIIGNALIFAAVHGHRPSFIPLFVLGMCLTIAFEWSGSILVAMTMHALFNSTALVFLAFPEIFPQ